MQKKNINILLITQLKNTECIEQANFCLNKIQKYKNIQVYSENNNLIPNTIILQNEKIINYVIVIGDNQTLIKTYKIFQHQNLPPILSIANGISPTLYNFSHCDINDTMEIFLEQIQTNSLTVQKMMKLRVLKNQQSIGEASCQVQFTRNSPNLLKLNLFIENQCFKDPFNFGMLWGDGIILSTPMGSLCRSMSLNGPLIYKQLQGILIIPVCPLSLKFRPLFLPSNTKIIIEVDKSSRSEAMINIDDQFRSVLQPGERIRVILSSYNIQMIKCLKEHYDQTWFQGIKQILTWGEIYSSK